MLQCDSSVELDHTSNIRSLLVIIVGDFEGSVLREKLARIL